MVKKKRVGKKARKKSVSKTQKKVGAAAKKIRHHTKEFVKKTVRIQHIIPTGIKTLILFSSIMGILYLILASMFSFTFLLGFVLQGAIARLFNILMILLIAFMIFGFYKRKIWGYKLANTVFFIIILNTLVSMFFVKKSVTGSLNLFVTFSFFFILMMNLITLWYVRQRKSYFTSLSHPTKLSGDDKAFIYGLSTLWIVFVFVAGVLGASFYNETVKKVDEVFDELYWSYPYEVEDICLKKGEDRDICLMTGAILYQERINSLKLCKSIKSQFYKYSCLKAIQGDEL